jgi:mono/diheme cytochrome c family protein
MRPILTGAALAAALCLPAAAEDPGATLFQTHCAACHGAGGQGDGPMAPLLTVAMPDLTLLARANDQDFPMLRVIRVIDGRMQLGGHGGPMPVFGALFEGPAAAVEGPGGLPVITRGKILSLAYYLESIQR